MSRTTSSLAFALQAPLIVGPTRAIRAGSASVALLATMLSACSDGTSPDRTAFGPLMSVAGGTVRTYVEWSSAGQPIEIGVLLSESALTGLPATYAVFLLPLPSQTALTTYKHVTLNWNPAGHPPPGIFTVPHFDVHFYTITEEQREAISPTDPEFGAKAARTPSAEFIPTGYVRDPGAVPNMGTHWGDPSSPVFNGQPFTRTFTYGSWDGTFTFYEPMFTKAFLETKPAITTVALKLPSRYSQAGFYPTSYTVGFDATSKEYMIALSGLAPSS